MTPVPTPAEDPNRFILPIRVYYEDTDAAGVVYYANYLRFCERARTEWLRALGFEQQVLMQDRGIAFVVRTVVADYRLPARLDDALDVVSQVVELRGASLVFAQNILRSKELIFESRVTVACLDVRRQRPCALPEALRNRLQHPNATRT